MTKRNEKDIRITAKDLAPDYTGLVNFFRNMGDSRVVREALAVDYRDLFQSFQIRRATPSFKR